MNDPTKKPNRRGQVVSAQLPHVILNQLDAIGADMGYNRTDALIFVIQTAFLQRNNVHVFVAPEKTPRQAAQLLAVRGRIVEIGGPAGSLGAGEAGRDNRLDPHRGEDHGDPKGV